MTGQAFTPEQEQAIDKIQKLLNVSAKAGTPEEAAAFASKAQDLLVRHNLDSAVLADAKAVKEGLRQEKMVEGGFYAYQRDLWRRVAELNFCAYWSQLYISDEVWKGHLVKKRRHALVGRAGNVRATVAMATYLQGAVERQLGKYLHGDAEVKFGNSLTNYAFSFRKGATDVICGKLVDRRLELLQDEARALKEAEVLRKEADGFSAGRAVTLAAYSKSEKEANDDHRFGEGWSAEKARQKAEEADMERRMEQAYTAWAAANPKEARGKFKFKDEKTGKTWHYSTRGYGGGPGSRGGSDGVDRGAYRAGSDAGEQVGLDPQTGAREQGAMIK